MTASSYEAVRKLEAKDKVSSFDCGEPALNQFLQRFALVNQKANSAQTYVCCQDGEVIAFYSLAVGSIEPSAASVRDAKGLSKHPVPVIILARLGVDKKGRGLGSALLKDALLRTMQAANIFGIRAILVHARDDAARNWYLGWGFEPSPTDSYHLFLLLKDVEKLIRP